MVTETEEQPYESKRRLVVIAVEPGQDPEVETDPEESFAHWELVAVLTRAVEIVEEDSILTQITEEDDNGSEEDS